MSQLPIAPSLSHDDIRITLDTFYRRVRRDDLLGPVFEAAVGTSDAGWDRHLARIGAFWRTVLRLGGSYHGDPLALHAALRGLRPEMFDRWLALFRASCSDTLPADAAAAAIDRAERIGRSLRIGLFERLPRQRATPSITTERE